MSCVTFLYTKLRYKLQLLSDVLIVAIKTFQHLERVPEHVAEYHILFEIFLLRLGNMCLFEDCLFTDVDIDGVTEAFWLGNLSIN